jgi:hypothetical protein
MRLCIGLAALSLALALSCGAKAAPDPETAKTIQHLLCRMVDGAAAANGIPAAFLTRLLWQESRFRSEATSPKGAEGVAQFMPQTAAERGLADPRDPSQAIDHAARFLAELEIRFGNLGLAAAAYNAGPARVEKWLNAAAELPAETRNYVVAVTGRSAEDWAARGRARREAMAAEPGLCLVLTAGLVRRVIEPPPPGVPVAKLDGTLANAIERLSVLADALKRQRLVPGAAVFAASRNPLSTHGGAEKLCNEIRALGAGCKVYGR